MQTEIDLVNGLLGFIYMYRTLKKNVFNHQSIKYNKGGIQFCDVFIKQDGKIPTSKNLKQSKAASKGCNSCLVEASVDCTRPLWFGSIFVS